MPAGNFPEPGCVLLIRWLGGIETPRLNVTRVPPRSSPEAWGHISSLMHMLLDIVRQSLSTLWAHKLRSFLTMFGIAWGVGSLLLLVGLGEGFRSGQQKQLATLGQNIMFMFPGRIAAVEGSTQSGQTYEEKIIREINSENKKKP